MTSPMPNRKRSFDSEETEYISSSGSSQASWKTWEADCILDERGHSGGNSEYLVKWKGRNPSTGKPYEPSWEKKSGCSKGLVNHWKKSKKEHPDIIGKAGADMESKSKSRKRKKNSAALPKSTIAPAKRLKEEGSGQTDLAIYTTLD